MDTETPRPEKLVLDFDTTVNSSPTDISGKGNHGTFKGTASYSPPDKAFKFDGAGATYIYSSGASGFPSGDAIYSIVGWVNLEPSISVVSSLLTFGSAWGVQTIGTLSINTSYGFQGSIGGDRVTSPDGVLTPNTWHHIAAVKVATGVCTVDTFDLYLDGVLITSKTYIGSNRTQAIGSGTKYLAIGGGFTGAASDACKGLISNPKLYSVALEPSEVKKLYRLGRTGRSMVISDTAVGIGKVPEAQLDVRGAVRFDRFTDKLRIDSPAGYQLSIGRSDANLNEFRWYAWGSGCNWYTPYTGKGIYIGRDGETISEYNFYNVTTVKKGGTTLHSSDDRLKRDEAFITNATDTLLKLKPQTYIKKHRLPENENDTDIPEQFEAGLIAQDVWYDAPELRFLVHPSKDANPSETKPVSPDPNDPTQDPDYSSWGTTQAYVNYEGFLPYLIKSNQEIYNELQAEKAKNLSKRHEHLVIENNRLKSKVTILENRQTHFNTLLVNLIGRIETLERPT